MNGSILNKMDDLLSIGSLLFTIFMFFNLKSVNWQFWKNMQEESKKLWYIVNLEDDKKNLCFDK